MNTSTSLRLLVASVVALAVYATPIEASGKQAVGRAAITRLLARDASRDAARAAEARALSKSATVWRYTSMAQAKRELHYGIHPGRHFTPRVTPGRPLRPKTAQRQYGLPNLPQVRTTVQLGKGQPVLRNKALGGQPGRGEVVNLRRVPPTAIRNSVNLRKMRPER